MFMFCIGFRRVDNDVNVNSLLRILYALGLAYNSVNANILSLALHRAPLALRNLIQISVAMKSIVGPEWT